MKKLVYILFFYLISTLIISNQTFAATCDQIFEGNMVRYNSGYNFSDTWNNGANRKVYINTYNVSFENRAFLDAGADFAFTSTLAANGYAVDPKTSMKILKTGSPWRIAQKPVTRSNATRTNSDFMIKYTIGYDFSNNYPDARDDTSHSECQYFSVTWCGDGVRDSGYEQCDPNDATKAGWGTGGCSTTCTPLVAPKVCGDGIKDMPNDLGFNEECDDGNLVDGDGCSSVCTVEPETTFCGDGEIQFPNDNGEFETCDDGNTVDGDGCSSVCTIEPVSTFCGDGEVQFPNDNGEFETCDDGNTVDGDGCSSVCTIEPNTTFCGDGEVQFPNDNGEFETCDDGNTVDGDGCSSVCTIEPVTTFCGDGIIQSPNDDGVFETCDDGNNINGDGCSSVCSIEVVTTFCGDGEVQFPNDNGEFETCDDGNNINGDGCSSVCTIEPFVPSISIDKLDGNPADLDGDVGGNDSQLVSSGAISVFKITVTNNGTDDLTNLVISDPMAGSCGGALTLPNFPPTFMSGAFFGSGTYTDNILQIGEGFEYYCDSNTLPPYVNTITVNGLGVLSSNLTNDSDTSAVLLQVPTPQIDIVKNDANPADLDLDVGGNDSQTVNSGSGAIFSITVTNNGTENLNNVVITDPSVAACNRNNAETQVLIQAIGNNDIVFDIGETFTYNCTDATVTADYTNTVAVAATGIGSGTAVNDTDTSAVVIFVPPVVPVCTNLTLSQSSGRSPYASNYNCTASGPTTFQVTLTDPNGNVVVDTSDTSGTFNINVQGTYTARCFVEGQNTTTPACIQTLNYSTGGGGGGSTSCREGRFTSTTASCEGNSRARFMRYTCENGVVLEKPGNNVSFSLAECNAGLDPAIDPTASRMNFSGAQCYASRTGSSWTSRAACEYDPGGGGGPFCGDGAVQTWRGEECDSTAGCDSSCKLNIVTYPSSGILNINAFDGIVMIGDKMDPYNVHNLAAPVLKNTGNINEDLVLDRFCAYVRPTNNSLNAPLTPVCKDIPDGILYPGEEVSLGGLTGQYEGNIIGIPGSNKTDDNEIVYTVVEADGNHSLDAYFNTDLTVRVVKPTITTTGGGTNYVKNNNLSNLNNIGSGVSGLGDNSNYVGAGIGNNLSSHSKDNIDSTDAEAEGSALENIVDDKLESKTTVDWIEYNGMDNVYYHQGNVNITSTFDINNNPIDGTAQSASKTYIIDGNLTIFENIEGYSGNLAFIVKGGNLTVMNNVTKLQGTYIVLPNDSGARGKIRGGINTTSNILHVKGSMYGENSHLLSKRTYIKNNSSGQIDVGTIVSFGSSVFRKPAPLTTKFLNDYLESTKVAQ